MSVESVCYQVGLYLRQLEGESLDNKVDAINRLRKMIHDISPFKTEPVDLVQWVKCDGVQANDYNPNSVAPPEMELLRVSIGNDGYTQPVVTWVGDEGREVVDGFHRTRVCNEFEDVNKRVHGYLPVVTIRDENTDKNNRIASTIRHNRARGKHRVDAMSDIVIELKNRNWKNERIARELGMEEDEVLRLCQITGLADLFSDEDFSRSWDVDADVVEFVQMSDDINMEEVEVRTVNTGDINRIFHTWDKWECFRAGFFNTTKEGMTKDECEQAYADFLSDDDTFRAALDVVISEWKYSCEQNLTNAALNRIAWLGQAAMCQATGVPSCFCGGFNLLTKDQQEKANSTALEYLNRWLEANDREPVDAGQAKTSRQSTLY